MVEDWAQLDHFYLSIQIPISAAKTLSRKDLMRKVMSHVSIGIMVLSLGFAMNPAFGDDNTVKNQSGWDKLSQLTPGQEIRVKQKDGKSIQGNFRSAAGEAIVVSLTSGEQTINRQSVNRISTKGKGHRGRNTLIGVGIGAGVGVLGGAAVGEGCLSNSFICWSRGEAMGVGTLLGALWAPLLAF